MFTYNYNASNSPINAPFPWYGGKFRIAKLVWDYFGDVSNFVEPFAGSLAVLLGRPTSPKLEQVNDIDCYLSNFWRAIKNDPVKVAEYADWPVNEADLTARHTWLRAQSDFRERMMTDPNFYDLKIAGWWVWGLSSWIGTCWCDLDSKMPKQRPCLAFNGINRVDMRGNKDKVIQCFEALAARLRNVIVCCGDWTRVVTKCVTVSHQVKTLTGVFLDPPYSGTHNLTYSFDSRTLSMEVREWAIKNGDNSLFRIALCGKVGEHLMPDKWTSIKWNGHGCYGTHGDGKGRDNGEREEIWFSPHCLNSTQRQYFL